MQSTRIRLAAYAAGFLLVLGTASSAHATRKLTTAQKNAADACDRSLANCWSFCMGTKDSATAAKCNKNCEDKWEKCLRDAGAWVENRPMPPKPKPKPPEMAPKASGAQAVSPTPKPTPAEKGERARSVNPQ